jgi:hypothetical protein
MTYPNRDRIDHPELQAPPTERLVPEDERTLPTSKNSVLMLSAVSALLSIMGGFVSFRMDNELVGLILAIAGLVVGIVAWVMAYGDARTGAITPAVATITAAVFCVIIGFDLADVDKKAANTTNTIIAPGGDAAVAVPQDPAAIVETKRANAGAATQP